MPTPTAVELVEASLARVWNERDDNARMIALQQLYHRDAVLYEPDAIVSGLPAICTTVGALLAQFPPGFRFEPAGPASGHHGVALARWQGIADGHVIATGHDVIRAENGVITALYVFLDPAATTPG